MDGLHNRICMCVGARRIQFAFVGFTLPIFIALSIRRYLCRAPFGFANDHKLLAKVQSSALRECVCVCFLCVFFYIFLLCRCNDSTLSIIASPSASCFAHLLPRISFVLWTAAIHRSPATFPLRLPGAIGFYPGGRKGGGDIVSASFPWRMTKTQLKIYEKVFGIKTLL